MKITYYESDHGFDIEMTPETPKEFAELLRFTQNAKAEKPSISTSYSSGGELRCSIWMKKINKDKQRNSISNDKK